MGWKTWLKELSTLYSFTLELTCIKGTTFFPPLHSLPPPLSECCKQVSGCENPPKVLVTDVVKLGSPRKAPLVLGQKEFSWNVSMERGWDCLQIYPAMSRTLMYTCWVASKTCFRGWCVPSHVSFLSFPFSFFHTHTGYCLYLSI